MKKATKIVLIILAILLVIFLILRALVNADKQDPEEFKIEATAMMTSASANFDKFDEFWALAPGQTDEMEEVVIRFQSGDEAWLIDDGNATALNPLPYPDKPHAIGHYAFPIVGGKKAVDLVTNPITSDANLGNDGELPFYLSMFNITPELPVQFGPITAVHEAFHKYVQTEPIWPGPNENGRNRAAVLPEVARPRILRDQLGRTLKQAWEEPEKRDVLLPQARKIWDTYNQEFPEEAANIRKTDIMEGAAEWVGYAFMARSMAGWDAPKEEVRAKTQEYLGQREPNSGSVDGESYELGLYAALILDDLYEDNAVWQLQANAKPLTEILLQDVEPSDIMPSFPKEEVQMFNDRVKQINALYVKDVEAIGNMWNAGTEDMVVMDKTSFFGGESIGYGGHYVAKNTPAEMYVGTGFSFDVTRDGVSAPLRGTVLLAEQVETPCGVDKIILARSQFPKEIHISSAPVKTLPNGGKLFCLN